MFVTKQADIMMRTTNLKAAARSSAPPSAAGRSGIKIAKS